MLMNKPKKCMRERKRSEKYFEWIETLDNFLCFHGKKAMALN